MKMIYDAFPFFNELELLEVRLNELDKVVDRFVLVEATRTHSNQPKPLYYAENKARFEPFHDRIIHVVVEDSPDTSDAWVIENFQRNCCLRALQGCDPQDVILISDMDEIPRASVVANAIDTLREMKTPLWNMLRPLLLPICNVHLVRRLLRKYHPRILKFEQTMYLYYLNCAKVSSSPWYGTRIAQYQDITSFNEMRYSGRVPIANGGWHFSFLGGAERIKYKLASFAHQEYNTPEHTDLQHLDEMLNSERWLFDETAELHFQEIDETYPRYILDNREKFEGLIKQFPPLGAKDATS